MFSLYFIYSFIDHSRIHYWYRTNGYRTCYRHKRELYSIYRNSNNLELKRHYQVYCKILSNVIKGGKRIYYDKKIKNQAMKVKLLGISLRS